MRELCAEARKFGFASVCVNPFWVELCAKELSGSGVLVCTVVGFPLGANAPETKAAEARLAVAQGAREIDMVINLGAAKAGGLEDGRGGHPRRREGVGRLARQSDNRDLLSLRLREGQGLRGRGQGGRPLRQDEHGIRHRAARRSRTCV